MAFATLHPPALPRIEELRFSITPKSTREWGGSVPSAFAVADGLAFDAQERHPSIYFNTSGQQKTGVLISCIGSSCSPITDGDQPAFLEWYRMLATFEPQLIMKVNIEVNSPCTLAKFIISAFPDAELHRFVPTLCQPERADEGTACMRFEGLL